MAKKLKFLSENRIGWRLPFKAVVASLTLFFVYLTGFSFLVVFIAFLLFLFLFLKESQERKIFSFSFWILTILGFLSFYLAGTSGAGGFILFGLAFLITVLFFIWFGLVNFSFPGRFAVYGLFNTVLFIFLFAVIFYWNLLSSLAYFELSLLWLLGLFFGITLIFREVFGFFGVFLGKRSWLAGFSLGFLALEIAWLLSFLPLGFINAATFLALFSILLRDSVLIHFQGHLNRSFVFRQLTFLIALSIIIFASSKWTV